MIQEVGVRGDEISEVQEAMVLKAAWDAHAAAHFCACDDLRDTASIEQSADECADLAKALTGRFGGTGMMEQELTVYIDPGDAPAELITEFYLALDALYRAHGGSGLRIVEDNDDQV